MLKIPCCGAVGQFTSYRSFYRQYDGRRDSFRESMGKRKWEVGSMKAESDKKPTRGLYNGDGDGLIRRTIKITMTSTKRRAAFGESGLRCGLLAATPARLASGDFQAGDEIGRRGPGGQVLDDFQVERVVPLGYR